MNIAHRVCLTIILLAAHVAAAAQISAEQPHDPNRIYSVNAGVGITTLLDFGEGNTILEHVNGFGSGWEVRERDHLLYLKPLDLDVDTNMFVRTTQGTYQFELRVVASDWKTLEQAKAAGVQYRIALQPPAALDVPTPPVPPPTLSSDVPSVALQPGRAYHFDYLARTSPRSRWMQPTQAYDDGRFTYLHIAPPVGSLGGFPTVLARDTERGDDLVVNSSAEDRVIIVHGVHPFLVLRHGEHAVLVRRVPAGGRP